MAEDRRPVHAALRTLLLAAMACIVAASASADPPTSADAAPSAPVPAPPDVAAPPRDAVRTPTGLAWKSLRPGVGTRHAAPTDVVEVYWSGWTADGTPIDNPSAQDRPTVSPVARLIPGFRQSVALLVEGETGRFWIPKAFAYGDGHGGRPSGALVFDIELVKVQ